MEARFSTETHEDACARGLPLDPGDRRLALSALQMARGLQLSRTTLVDKMAFRHAVGGVDAGSRQRHAEARTASIRVVELLVRTGRFVSSGGRLKVGRDAAFEADLASGMTGMEAAGRASARLHFDDPDDAARAAAFHADARTLYGLHPVGSAGAGAVVVPSSVEIRDGRIAAGSSCAVVVHAGRVGIVRDTGRSASVSVGLDGVRGTIVELDVAAVSGRMQADPVLGAIPIIAVSGRSRSLAVLPSAVDEALSSCLAVRRDVFETWMGRPVGDEVWADFSSSLRKGEKRAKGIVLQRMICRLLEPEARRAALRSHTADLELYQFYCGTDERTGLWRRQASEALPLFAARLPEVAEAIDAGGAPVPAVAARLDVPEARIRELHGVGWRRTGAVLQKQLEVDDGKAVFATALRSLPPQLRLDSARPPKDLHGLEEDQRDRPWVEGLSYLGREIVSLFGGYLPEPLKVAYSRDPQSFLTALADRAILRDAVAVPAGYVEVLVSGDPKRRLRSTAAARMVAAEILGPGGSLKRWRRRAELFHRALPAVQEALAAEAARMEDGIEQSYAEWTPTDGPFLAAGGRIEWLSTYEALHVEGLSMGHCVATHFTAVATVESCVGAVFGSNGSRSTVEFGLDDDDGAAFRLRQHQARHNTAPDPSCVAVVSAFRTALKERAVVPDLAAATAAGRSNERLVRRLDPFGRVASEDPLGALELVRPVLPPELAGCTLEELVVRTEAERDAHPLVVPMVPRNQVFAI